MPLVPKPRPSHSSDDEEAVGRRKPLLGGYRGFPTCVCRAQPDCDSEDRGKRRHENKASLPCVEGGTQEQ